MTIKGSKIVAYWYLLLAVCVLNYRHHGRRLLDQAIWIFATFSRRNAGGNNAITEGGPLKISVLSGVKFSHQKMK